MYKLKKKNKSFISTCNRWKWSNAYATEQYKGSTKHFKRWVFWAFFLFVSLLLFGFLSMVIFFFILFFCPFQTTHILYMKCKIFFFSFRLKRLIGMIITDIYFKWLYEWQNILLYTRQYELKRFNLNLYM